jgi:hypothetical protein
MSMASVRKQSRYLKTLYFLFYIGLGISSPYFGIFYKHVLIRADGTPAIGLIGLIFFAMPLVSLVAKKTPSSDGFSSSFLSTGW